MLKHVLTQLRWGLLAGLLLVLGTSAAHAESVNLKLSVIHATKTKAPADPALKKIQRQLKRAFGNYSGFRLLDRQTLKLKVGKAERVKLANGDTAIFTYKGQKKGRHKVNFSVPKRRVNVELSVPERKLFFQAGLKHKRGMLVLALYLRD